MTLQYILASASPRRRELFGLVRDDFRILVPAVREDLPDGVSGAAAAEYLAGLKGGAAAAQFALPDAVFISADTVVCIDGRVLGKPRDVRDACDMLSLLSGRTHTVHTGVALIHGESRCVFSETTSVEFYPLSDGLIREYAATGEPLDKAGAYGIQGRGSLLVKGITGDYFNVVGLPVARLFRELAEFERGISQR